MLPHNKPVAGTQINPLHPLSRGLVGCWLFNEGAGSLANDISGVKNHGRLTNMAPNVHGSGWGGSKLGWLLKFDGVDNYVDGGYNSNLDFNGANKSFTVETWLNINSLAEDQGIVSRWHGTGSYQYTLKFESSSNSIKFAIYDGVFQVAESIASSVQINTWIHVVGKADNGTIQVYIDGITSGTTDTYGTIVDIGSEVNLSIGVESVDIAGGKHFDGSINFVRIYNRALSVEEVKLLYEDPFCNMMKKPINRYYTAIAAALKPMWYYDLLRRRN